MIYIYGDSFADIGNRCEPNTNLIPHTWPAKLQEKYSVINYAESGSGIEFSYLRLIDTQHLFTAQDKIIFVASSIKRFYIASEWRKSLGESSQHVNDPYNKKMNKGRYSQEINLAAKLSLKYFNDWQINRNRYFALLYHLRQFLGDRVLILEVFRDNKPENRNQQPTDIISLIDNPDVCLVDIYEHENREIWSGPKGYDYTRTPDQRVCHLTETHHSMLYDKIVDWIEGAAFKIDKGDLLDLPKHVKHKYLHNTV